MPNGFTRQNFSQKNLVGFTLLELLIVIGILAILSTTMIMVINPAEMLKRARDSQRMSDLATLKSAIALYLADVSTPSIGTVGTSYSHVSGVACATTSASSSSQAITGSGWIPINFNSISGGSPIDKEPIDPNPTASNVSPYLYYTYIVGNNNTFKLAANMESTSYASTEGTDGGKWNTVYEVGTDLTLGISAPAANCYGP